jgi:hypothetical protein
MLTKTGAKLLDFGLAKLRGGPGPISLTGMGRLATTTPGTGDGVIVGFKPASRSQAVHTGSITR